jgi:hypothetical protein
MEASDFGTWMTTMNKTTRPAYSSVAGQTKNSEELETAHKVRDRLKELGFDPYVAVEEQTLRGLKENLFPRLRDSEYFVFVDFRRERLVPSVQRKLDLVWSRKMEHAARVAASCCESRRSVYQTSVRRATTIRPARRRTMSRVGFMVGNPEQLGLRCAR